MYVPDGEARAAAEEEGVRPRSLRWVGVRGISDIWSRGAHSGRRALEAPKRRRRRRVVMVRDVRVAGRVVRDLFPLLIALVWCLFLVMVRDV